MKTASQKLQHGAKRLLERLCGPTGAILLHLAILLCLLYYTPALKEEISDDFQVVVLEPTDTPPEPEIICFDDMDEPDIHFETFDMAIPAPDVVEPEINTFINEETFAIANIESVVHLAGFFATDEASLSEAKLRSGSSAFGFNQFIKGDLVGTMYDLKRNASRQPRDVHFEENLRQLVDARFSKQALREYYRVPKQLYLSHLFIPYMPADKGPAAFGVEKLMEPRQWIIHYAGEMQTLLSGRYRFVGEFDDILLVFVNGNLVLEAGWGNPITDWRPTDHVGQHPCFTTHALVYGDWFELPPLKPARIDIVIGENPGGMMGGLLLVQQEHQDYAYAENGRPILPLFAVQPLTEEEQAIVRSVSGFAVADRTPIMGTQQDIVRRKTKSENDDVIVTIF